MTPGADALEKNDAGGDAPPAILLTRPAPQSGALARKLALRGWAPVISPLTELRALPAAPDLSGVAALVFTSANGVRCAALPPEARALPAFCVGPATAAAAAAAGFSPVEGPSDAAALAALILTGALSGPPPGAILHLRGAHGTGTLAAPLREAGLRVEEAVVYEMTALPRLADEARRAILSGEVRAATLYSPRAARLFAERIAAAPALAEAARALHAVVISAATAAALDGTGLEKIHVARNPDGAAMEAAIAALPFAPRGLL